MTQNVILPPKINEELRQFVPEWYQWGIIDAMEKEGKKNAILVWARRAGKDITALNIVLRMALKRRGSYLYMLPLQKQAVQVVWDGMTFEGKSLLSYIPDSLIVAKHKQERKITLVNGSILYFCGSNHYDSYRGISPMGIVMSEAAYSHPQALPTFIPALERNAAFTILISTPFGENWYYDQYTRALNSPDWFTQFLTVKDTKHISEEAIKKQIETGLISADMAEQEYYCSFSIGSTGSYYSKYLNDMELREQIADIPWDRGKKTYTSWDIGKNDQCAILWFQLDNNKINVIDFYQNSNVGLDHYVQVVKSKAYIYGDYGHLWPHDGDVSDFVLPGTTTRKDIAEGMGLNVQIVPRGGLLAGIEKVRTMLSRIYIDEKNCRGLIKALRDYRKEYDSLRKIYKDKPLHDENSDAADALRTLCMGLYLVSDGMTAEDAQTLRNKAMYGYAESNLPKQLRSNKYGTF